MPFPVVSLTVSFRSVSPEDIPKPMKLFKEEFESGERIVKRYGSMPLFLFIANVYVAKFQFARRNRRYTQEGTGVGILNPCLGNAEIHHGCPRE